MRLLLCYFDPKAKKIFVEHKDEKGNTVRALSSPYNFVYKNELVAKVINVETQEEAPSQIDEGYNFYRIEQNTSVKPGEGIFFDSEAKLFKANNFGFVVIEDATQKIKLINPLQITRDKVSAYFMVFPTKFGQLPSYKDIEDLLMSRKILALVDKSEIEAQLSNIDINEKKIHRITVAKGREPVNGFEEYFVPLIKLEKKAGKVLEDGRIDFKEQDSIIEIKRGQEILKKIPGVKEEEGMDIYGDKVSAGFEVKEGYLKGDHIVPSMGDANIFISDIDGCLSVEGKKISVTPIAIIRGNVDYDSGNIDFNGSVHIMGSILPGFSVKAKGDIIVEKNADDAYLEAEGSVMVKQGIAGKGSMKVVSGNKLKAKYILNADVEAVGEIEVEDSIINSKVFSNDKISVTAKHGKIIGGETIARHEIIANVAGVPKENETKLTAGVSLFVERELTGIRKDIEILKNEIDDTLRKIKTSFGEGLFEDPKKFLAILPPVKKKSCLELLKQLTANNKEMAVLNNKRIEAESKLKLEREPVVIITEEVFPNTLIGIKKRKRRINEKLTNVKFYEDPEEKEIRYTSVV